MPVSALIPVQRRSPPMVQTAPVLYLAAPLVVLAGLTFLALFVHSDVEAALLWSQCASHERLPGVSRIPGIGAILCYLPSFMGEAIASDSWRASAITSAILSFVGGLLTVSQVESARYCNRPGRFVRKPTAPWMLFNLLGGATVWQLLIVPAFLARARNQLLLKDDAAGEKDRRHLPSEEVIAIPVGVALGFVVPSGLVIFQRSPAAVCVWLFFPMLVTGFRYATRWGVWKLQKSGAGPLHLESNRKSMALVYALPVVLSLLSHGFLVGNLTFGRDDRKEMTHSTLKYIEIDAQAIGATVLYWLLAEVGWQAPVALLVSSIILGPGAGVCLTWSLDRETLFQKALAAVFDGPVPGTERPEDEENPEETPLLR